MPELTATIEGVFNDGPRTDIKAGGKKLVTWKEDLNRLARSLEGQECRIKYTVKKKGEYENFYFDGAEPVAQPEQEPPVWTNPGDVNEQRRTDIRVQGAAKLVLGDKGLIDRPEMDLQAVFDLTAVVAAGLKRLQDGGS